MLSNGALETPKAWITPTRPAVAAEGPPEPRPVTSPLSAWEPAPRTQRALGLCWLPQAWVLKTLGSTLSCLAQSARGPSWRPPISSTLGRDPNKACAPCHVQDKATSRAGLEEPGGQGQDPDLSYSSGASLAGGLPGGGGQTHPGAPDPPPRLPAPSTWPPEPEPPPGPSASPRGT